MESPSAVSARTSHVKPVGGTADRPDAPPSIDTLASRYTKQSTDHVTEVYASLREETRLIEANIALGEHEVQQRDDLAFLLGRQERARQHMLTTQRTDLAKRKAGLLAVLSARAERKSAKREARESIRAAKRRDCLIQQQEQSADAAGKIRDAIGERRSAFDELCNHFYAVHEKQRNSLSKSQMRVMDNEKLLIDLETRHLRPEHRGTILKKFQTRQNHMGHLNKRINDNLREVQLMELRHSKDRFEREMVSMDEVGLMEIAQENTISDVKMRHQLELHAEKESILHKMEQAKEAMLKVRHAAELKELLFEQKMDLRQLKIKQQNDSGQILSKTGSKTGSSAGSSVGSHMGSSKGSGAASPSLRESEGGEVQDGDGELTRAVTQGEQYVQSESKDDSAAEYVRIKKMEQAIELLKTRHADEMRDVLAQAKSEMDESTLSQEVLFTDMIESQESAHNKLTADHEREIEALREVQEKEIKIEEQIHDAEMSMLVERRVLNSVLDTMSDGIINITPMGIVTRFNRAAETIFGYTAAEVIGNNVTMLMPSRYADEHDSHLLNYQSTGVSAIVSARIGRRLIGLRKSGEEFPLQLGISELKADDSHLFTGIARDLTREENLQAAHQAAEDLKNQELAVLMASLSESEGRAYNLLSKMLPPSVSQQLIKGQKVVPQTFQCASVFFLDVVGFTTISAQVPPLEVVDLLSALFTLIDAVLEFYNVYKVETIGDSYMICSGLPTENDDHAEQLATMALHLVWAVDSFVYNSKPDLKIKIRCGINSGPVVAGVVGKKMPRYCLFGDTVNTASRMESNGQPGRVHVSTTTAELLRRSGDFELESRGEIDVKGKGKMSTFWIQSKRNFNPENSAPVFDHALQDMSTSFDHMMSMESLPTRSHRASTRDLARDAFSRRASVCAVTDTLVRRESVAAVAEGLGRRASVASVPRLTAEESNL